MMNLAGIKLFVIFQFISISNAYFTGPEGLSWEDSKEYCNCQGTTLALIETASEWTDANSTCGASTSDGCWIALNDIDTEGSFIWDSCSITGEIYGFSNGTPVEDFPWNVGSPDTTTGNIRDCIVLRAIASEGVQGYLDDVCSSTLYRPLCNDVPAEGSTPTCEYTAECGYENLAKFSFNGPGTSEGTLIGKTLMKPQDIPFVIELGVVPKLTALDPYKLVHLTKENDDNNSISITSIPSPSEQSVKVEFKLDGQILSLPPKVYCSNCNGQQEYKIRASIENDGAKICTESSCQSMALPTASKLDSTGMNQASLPTRVYSNTRNVNGEFCNGATSNICQSPEITSIHYPGYGLNNNGYEFGDVVIWKDQYYKPINIEYDFTLDTEATEEYVIICMGNGGCSGNNNWISFSAVPSPSENSTSVRMNIDLDGTLSTVSLPPIGHCGSCGPHKIEANVDDESASITHGTTTQTMNLPKAVSSSGFVDNNAPVGRLPAKVYKAGSKVTVDTIN